MSPVSKWLGNTRAMPWWLETIPFIVCIVVITSLRLTVVTMIIAGTAYVVGMQILRVYINDRRGGSASRSDSA
jgi:hypothetical protein